MRQFFPARITTADTKKTITFPFSLTCASCFTVVIFILRSLIHDELQLNDTELRSITQLCTLHGDELKIVNQLYTLPADDLKTITQLCTLRGDELKTINQLYTLRDRLVSSRR